MKVYDINSWHYKLILWTWGKHFFESSEIDWKKIEDMRGDDLIKTTYDMLPKKYSSKTVNFCPYCRAVLGSVITAPFLYLKRLKYPYIENENKTRADIMKASSRRTFISLAIAGGVNYGVAAYQMIREESLIVGVPSITIGTGLILLYYKRESLGKNFLKFGEWLSKTLPKIKFPKWQRKKKVKVKVDRPPNKMIEAIRSKHDVYCPPVHFIDKSKPEEHK